MQKINPAAKGRDHLLKRVGKKIKIFKKPQDSKVPENTEEQEQFSPFLRFRSVDLLPDVKIKDRRRSDQDTKTPVPVSVKNITADEQVDCPEFPGQQKK